MPLESQKIQQEQPKYETKLLKSKKHFAQDAHYVYQLVMRALSEWLMKKQNYFEMTTATVWATDRLPVQQEPLHLKNVKRYLTTKLL